MLKKTIIVAGQLKRLITTQNSQKLKTIYLVLLDQVLLLPSIQKQQKLNKILDITDLAKKVALISKVEEIESKIYNINNLTTKTALNSKSIEAECKIPALCFITTHEFNRLT